MTIASERRGATPREVARCLGMFVIVTIAPYWVLDGAWAVISNLGMLGLVGTRYARKWTSKPDYVVKGTGTAIWTCGLDIPYHAMYSALCHFTAVLQENQRDATRAQLADMLSNTCIVWSKGPVSFHEHALIDKEGIQHGYHIWVRWNGSIKDSALYHELLHEVNETIRRGQLPRWARADFDKQDLEHRETEWWDLEKLLVDIDY